MRHKEQMTALQARRFLPDPEATAVYDELYGIYRALHDAFGGVRDAHPDLSTVMKRLLVIKERAPR